MTTINFIKDCSGSMDKLQGWKDVPASFVIADSF